MKMFVFIYISFEVFNFFFLKNFQTIYNNKSQQFVIFFENMNEPLKINISKSAKISDLIGLSCFKYIEQQLMPKLK